MNVKDCVREVLQLGLDDWVQAAEVKSVVLTLCGDEERGERIEKRWGAIHPSPGLGDVCWLAITPKGEALLT